jgi:hypothetical protein
MNNAWTTVASKSSNRVINAVAPQSNIGTSINLLPTKSIGKESTAVWDMDSHKVINGSRYVYINHTVLLIILFLNILLIDSI